MKTLMMGRLTILCLMLTLALAPTVGSAAKPIPPRAAAAQTGAPSSVIVWGAADPSYDLTPPADLGRVIAVAIGSRHAAALKADGRVVVWGDNRRGVLNVPPGLGRVKAIASSADHILALKADGTVLAWGSNDAGQNNVPAGLNNIVAIAAGSLHSLALKADGTVVAWGAFNPNLTTPAGLNNVKAIAAGGGHNLALKDDGTVVAWGNNNSGQTDVPAGLSNVMAIAAGGLHSLALKDDGTVVAWGKNDQGESTVPAGLSNVTAISAALVNSLALKADGTVVAWGFAEITRVPAGLRNVTAIAAGYTQSLALVTEPQAFAPSCATVCFRAPQYYLNRLDGLPNGTVSIAGGGRLNSTINTSNRTQMKLALDGGNSAPERFNQQYVALQLSLLATPGLDQDALRSQLSCFGLSFAPVTFSFGLPINPRSSLSNLLSSANFALFNGSAADLDALAGILAQLNGNDATGQCN